MVNFVISRPRRLKIIVEHWDPVPRDGGAEDH